MNYLQQIGAVAIASRLRSLTDILIRDAVRIYQEQGIDFEPRWFTTVRLLKEKGELSVIEIADNLNMTHPSVNQICNALEKRGLVNSSASKTDRRKRLIQLSREGVHLTKDLEPLWKVIETAVTELFYETQPDFLEIITDIEFALERKSMYERFRDLLRQVQYEEIEIIDFMKIYRDDFREMNYEWLNEYFEVEEKDEEILREPEKIIASGGNVIFARLKGKVVGTSALMHISDQECELTKMAVRPEYQGKQIGKKMLDWLIELAKRKDYQRMILYTSPKLKKAFGLYKSRGFKILNPIPVPIGGYKRPSIKMGMVLNLTDQMFTP
jgi:DNA-binding MarR family transcriptional regulator/predicted GNAT family acetyltransferase